MSLAYFTSLIIFILSAVLFIHSYLLYPLSLTILSRIKYSNICSDLSHWPSVTVVIAAYNEESVIGAKIENTLELRYPGPFDIVVFSDASADRTDEIVRQYSDDGVELIRIEGRVGKTACQNRVVDQLDSDIVVFSDANSMYEPAALEELVRIAETGAECVVGELRYRSGDVEGESLYWRYERFLKQLEDSVGTTVSGNGAIYAVKREAYVPLADDEISDFAEPLAILQEGGEIAYTSSAVAYENTAASMGSELQRRIRISTRSWHTLWRYRDLLNPVTGPEVAYKLWSHKLLRWLSPLFLIAIFTSTLLLTVIQGGVVFPVLLALQLVFYTVALVGHVLDQHADSLPVVVHVPCYFTMANWGLFVGLLNFVRGRNIVSWETSDRLNDD